MKKLAVILISGTVLIVLAVAIVSWLSWQPQGWYSPPDYSNPDVEDLALQTDELLRYEFLRADREPPDKVWIIQIPDKAMNAWLSGTLRGWLSHDQELEIPKEIQGLQIHTTTDGLWIAAMVEIEGSEPRPVATKINVWTQGGKAFVKPTAVRIGKIPIPLFLLEELFELQIENTVQPIISLSDVREVEILDITFEDGAIVLTCQTLLTQ
jgi:hypothetical protein